MANATAAVEAGHGAAKAAEGDDQTGRGGRQIKEGDTVILDGNGDRQSFATVKLTGQVKVGKVQCPVAPLIGAPYGSWFQVDTDAKCLRPCKRQRLESWPEASAPDQVKDNSQLVDAGTLNQALTADDIQALRAAGKAPEDIIQALEENSATFQGKTAFSQEKYRRKKAKKYFMLVCAVRPTARSICEVYFNKSPNKTNFLRFDILALLLNLANVGSHAKVLVVETCGGLVIGAVAERLGGYGAVCAAHFGPAFPSIDIVRLFNLPDAARRAVSTARISSLLAARSAVVGPPALEQQDEQPANGIAASLGMQPTGGSQPPDAAQSSQQKQPPMAEQATAVVDSTPSEAQQPPDVPLTMQDELDTTTAAQLQSADQPPAASDVDTKMVMGDAEPAVASALAPGASLAQVHAPAMAAVVSLPEAEAQGRPSADTIPAAASAAGSETATGLQDGGLGNPIGAAAQTAKPGPRPGGRGGNAIREATEEQIAQLCGAQAASGGFTSCIVACPGVYPAAAVQQVLPLLAPSAAFVVFSNWQQPLAECLAQLQSSRAALALQLSESWCREWQVLPGRTHPEMATSGTGGYILSGITIARGGPPM